MNSLGNSSVIRYDGTTGGLIDAFVSPGSGGLSGNHGLTFGPHGDLYVASFNQHRIFRFMNLTSNFRYWPKAAVQYRELSTV